MGSEPLGPQPQPLGPEVDRWLEIGIGQVITLQALPLGLDQGIGIIR